MAKLSLKQGTTSKSVLIFVQDSSQSTGVGLSGLVYNTSSLVAYYCQPGITGATAITLATLASTTSAFSSGGFKEIDATNMKGVYRLDIPNAALTGATDVVVMLSGAANMTPVVLEIELTAIDNQDSVRAGMTALPNAAAAASGGVLVYGTGTGAINPSSGNVGVTGTVTVGTNNDKTGYSLTQAFPANFSSLAIDASGNVYTKTQVKKNTAISYFVFKVVLSSDHLTGATGKTVSCTRSINGAALAATNTATATEISNGFYYVPLAASDVNGDTILFRATASSCDPTEITIYTQP